MLTFGLILPTIRATSSPELIEAAAETAERLGWNAVWTTDHLLVPRSLEAEYGRAYEAIVTLGWVGARNPTLQLGISVVVVPMRNAVVLAKELATLDDLSGGRLLAGVGVGWVEAEFANVGVGDRFHQRGAYLDETIRLWRHLWSGSGEPFEGPFHRFTDFAFEPLPVRRDATPIVVGGRSPAALKRAGALADWYQSTGTGPSAFAERIEALRSAATQAGRPMPRLSARVRATFDRGEHPEAVLGGDPPAIVEKVRAFEAVGVEDLAIAFETDGDPDALGRTIERFDAEVVRALG
ncbi:MAG TPA: TIGR03619 family F420-dependent LLM class oxidoreductase [Candidatus Dormibacteraeota bacterium]|nr:TIGR03619 family F420-dependent LLM class oxidoreductase [Candidatus Dormibacteraeota bacterium]